jgi:hypothetical protein
MKAMFASPVLVAIVTSGLTATATIFVGWLSLRGTIVKARTDQAISQTTNEHDLTEQLITVVSDLGKAVTGIDRTISANTTTLAQLSQNSDDIRMDIARLYALGKAEQPSQTTRRRVPAT